MSWNRLIEQQPEDGKRFRGNRFFITLIRSLLKPLIRFYFPLRSSGHEHIPTDGPAILAANHQSYLDPVFISCALNTRQGLNTCFLAKDKHFDTRFRRWFARSVQVMLINPRTRLRQIIPQLGAIVKAGQHLAIFPEGTRTPDGSVREFKKTFALLATATGTPVVPVAIQGAWEAAPTGKKRPGRVPVTIRFLEPIPSEGKEPGELANEVETAVRNSLENQG